MPVHITYDTNETDAKIASTLFVLRGDTELKGFPFSSLET